MDSRFDVPAVLHELTIEEKAALVSGSGYWWTRSVDRLSIPAIMVSDGPHGLRKQTRNGDHVGIGGSFPATCFPTASALGSSWDVDLVRRVGVAIGQEARAENIAVVLGPGINIKRSPLCGRNFEYLSEDPLIAGELGAAMVDGIQSQGVGTSLKHFAANNQETDRLRVSAEIDARTLREIYLAGFERVVRNAGPWTVMCSYNRINGVYASQDPWLLTELLRGEWGFDGLVVSDWGAVADPVAAVTAGLDLEMPSSAGVSARAIVTAVESGDVDVAVLDLAIERLLQLIDRAMPGVESDDSCDLDDHHRFARAVAADCAVLLKNDGPILPITMTSGRIAVIGEFARSPRFQGAGSSKVNPTRIDKALAALQDGLGPDVTVDFASGFGVDDPTADSDALLAEAVETARNADITVLFLGLPPSFESEGYDRAHMDLPVEQIEVLEAVAAVNECVVVVLANGSVIAVADWQQHAGAILEGWLGGQAGGGAIADLLLGVVNPSGRLAETMPLRLQDTPAHLNFPGENSVVRYGEGLYVGYRHYDTLGREVSYPFGHGLSYTTFDYSGLSVVALDRSVVTSDWQGAPIVSVAVTVTNTGSVAGREVIQVYVADLTATAPRPSHELKAFAKVLLAPGDSQRVEFVLTERDLSYWSSHANRWVLEPGTFEISIGASSRDIRGRHRVDIDGVSLVIPLHRGSTVAEWRDHPIGHGILLEKLRDSPSGDLSFILEPELIRSLGSFPLVRLPRVLRASLGDNFVDEWLSLLDR